MTTVAVCNTAIAVAQPTHTSTHNCVCMHTQTHMGTCVCGCVKVKTRVLLCTCSSADYSTAVDGAQKGHKYIIKFSRSHRSGMYTSAHIYLVCRTSAYLCGKYASAYL